MVSQKRRRYVVCGLKNPNEICLLCKVVKTMKSDFEKWADSFYDDRFKSPNAIEHILFKIEDGSKYGAETGVYKCQESYFIPHESSIFYTTPVYRVWVLGKDILATTNYREAIDIYQNAVNEITSNISS